MGTQAGPSRSGPSEEARGRLALQPSQPRAARGPGGITKDAKREIRTDRLGMRVWTTDDFLDELFDVYDRLPDEYRVSIPLKRAWVLDEEAG